MKAGQIWMVTGASGAGKTTLCQKVIESARQAGWDVAGLLTPARLEQGVKTGILCEDLRNGKMQLLASRTAKKKDDLIFGKWFFDRHTLEWGNRVLQSSLPCDLFVVDELGPLEFNLQLGWQAALQVIPCGKYSLALVVIRPELQEQACRLLNFSGIIAIDSTQAIDNRVYSLVPEILKLKTDR